MGGTVIEFKEAILDYLESVYPERREVMGIARYLNENEVDPNGFALYITDVHDVFIQALNELQDEAKITVKKQAIDGNEVERCRWVDTTPNTGGVIG